MTVIVDSDILIDLVRGRDTLLVTQWHAAIASTDVFACSTVSMAELWRGARVNETTDMEKMFNALLCIPLDAAAGRLAGDLMRQFGPSHGVRIADALIGATAIVSGAQLWTRNYRHYPAKAQQFYTPPGPLVQ